MYHFDIKVWDASNDDLIVAVGTGHPNAAIYRALLDMKGDRYTDEKFLNIIKARACNVRR